MPLDLFPYQQLGADFLASKSRAAIFDDPGVGKTAQAIRALDATNAKRCVIVCPAAVREVWLGEHRKFARLPRRVIKGRDIHDLNLWLRGRVDVLLLSYQMAAKWAKRMEGDLFDAIVFDESHYLKNKATDWTRALIGAECDGRYGLARWALRAWFLTGTPNPNDAADIWSTMRFCGATPCSHRIFTDRYFRKQAGAYSTRHTVRDEMVPELRLAIQSFSLRRTKKQAGLDLPPIWLTTINVDGDTKEVRELLRGHPGLEKAIVEAVEKGGLSFLDAQHIATLRRLVGEAKAPAFVELLLEELKDGLQKVVVFGVHRRALAHIGQGLRSQGVSHVEFTGDTSDRGRGDAVRRFQEDDLCRVFLGNIRAAGNGLTLTAAADVIMFESDWTPAGNAQALQRVHRIGQDKQVHARFVVLANSVDEYVSEVVARKTRDILKLGTFSEIAA
jgi:SWI/SNF-related matrix-associated actin-dependent regulator 1 of chromatin subfamily A